MNEEDEEQNSRGRASEREKSASSVLSSLSIPRALVARCWMLDRFTRWIVFLAWKTFNLLDRSRSI
jgi:hypothetical protein